MLHIPTLPVKAEYIAMYCLAMLSNAEQCKVILKNLSNTE